MTDINPLPTHEAAEQIAGLLTDDLQAGDQTPVPGAAEPHDGPAEAPARAQPARPADDDADDDVPAAKPADDAQEPSTEDRLADEAEKDAEQAAPTGDVFTVKIDGQELQVGREELLAGYQRHADYSRKTAEVAEHRRAAEADREVYGQLIGALSARLNELQPSEPNWQALAATDPSAYVYHQELARQRAAVASEEQRLAAIEEQRDAAYKAHRTQASQSWLLEQIPEWSDPATRTKDLGAIVSQARTLGFSNEELAAADDPRILFLARKAAKYDELMAQAENVKRSAVQRNHKKVLPAGSAASVDNAPRAKAKGMEKLKASGGSIEVAAGLLAGMVE